jgi:hypothetical protein
LGASLVASSSGARGSADYGAAAADRWLDSWLDLFQTTANVGNKKP